VARSRLQRQPTPVLFSFGPFNLDVAERRLTRDAVPVPLQPRSLDVLAYLLEHAGSLAPKDDILEAVWGGALVTENSLTRCIRQIRVALDDDASAPQYVETVAGSGYRFIATVRQTLHPAFPEAPGRTATHEPESPPAFGPADPAPPRTVTIRRHKLLLGTVFVTAAGLLLWGIVFQQRPIDVPRIAAPETRFSLALPESLDVTPYSYFEMFVPPPLAISPDGRDTVFSARGEDGRYRLYRRPIDRFHTEPIAGTAGATDPFFSPDGRWIGFVAARALKRIRVAGGAPRTIVPFLPGSGFGGAHWSADDVIVYAPSAVAGLYAVPAAGGTSTQLSLPDARAGELSHVMPQVLPNDDILFSVRMGLAPESPVVQILKSDGTRATLLRNAMGARWAEGRLVYSGTGADTGSLWAASYRPGESGLGDQPRRVLEPVAADLYALAYFDLSDSGSLVYVPPARERPRDHVFLWNHDGPHEVLAETSDNYIIPAISPDGSKVAVTLINDKRQMSLWLLDTRRGPPMRLPTIGEHMHGAIWSPDGSALVFTSDHEGPSNLYRVELASNHVVRLTRSEQHHDAASFHPDGQMLTYAELHPDTNWDIWQLDVASRDARPIRRTGAEEMQPILSPDGSLLAYTSNETGRREIYLQPFSGAGTRMRVSSGGGEDPLWSHDGTRLYYRWQSHIYQVSVTGKSSLTLSRPREILEGDFEGRTGYGKANWDMTADGRILLSSRQTYTLDRQLNVILNWSAVHDVDATASR